jgi:hypothetical protein
MMTVSRRLNVEKEEQTPPGPNSRLCDHNLKPIYTALLG